MQVKKCFKCQAVRPLSEFYVHPMMADGHLNKCKECTKRDARRNYVKDPAKRQAYERRRGRTRERRDAKLRYKREWRERYPEKYKAHTAVNNAIRRGDMKRQPCRVCGRKAQAHHRDYSKPFEVEWLCVRHHHDVHGNIARGE